MHTFNFPTSWIHKSTRLESPDFSSFLDPYVFTSDGAQDLLIKPQTLYALCKMTMLFLHAANDSQTLITLSGYLAAMENCKVLTACPIRGAKRTLLSDCILPSESIEKCIC